jgi:hypothetical protein
MARTLLVCQLLPIMFSQNAASFGFCQAQDNVIAMALPSRRPALEMMTFAVFGVGKEKTSKTLFWVTRKASDPAWHCKVHDFDEFGVARLRVVTRTEAAMKRVLHHMIHVHSFEDCSGAYVQGGGDVTASKTWIPQHALVFESMWRAHDNQPDYIIGFITDLVATA